MEPVSSWGLLAAGCVSMVFSAAPELAFIQHLGQQFSGKAVACPSTCKAEPGVESCFAKAQTSFRHYLVTHGQTKLGEILGFLRAVNLNYGKMTIQSLGSL